MLSQSQYRLKGECFANVPKFTVATKYRRSIGARRKHLQKSTLMLDRDVKAVAEQHGAQPLILLLKGNTVQTLQYRGKRKS
jgi:hypothetical protein